MADFRKSVVSANGVRFATLETGDGPLILRCSRRLHWRYFADGMEALFPNGLRKVVIPDAGHFVHQEQPDEVNETVLDFLCGS